MRRSLLLAVLLSLLACVPAGASVAGHCAKTRTDMAATDECRYTVPEIERITRRAFEFARLRRKGLVRSARGPGGGYRLARTAAETSIAEIVLAVDEPLRATRCGAGKGCMVKGERCLTHDLWADLGSRIEDYLASVSLADVAMGRLSPDRRAA